MYDKEKLRQNGIAYWEGVERFANKEQMYEKYLKKFLEDTNFAMLKDAVERNDVDGAFKLAHTLKGTSGNLSLLELHESCSDMVEAIRNGQRDNIAELFEKVEKSYLKVVGTLTEGM